MRAPPIPFPALARQAARRYRPAGRFVEGFVQGKLRHDPVYAHLLAHWEEWLPQAGLVLDLGCGRGILLALLAAARRLGEERLAGIRLKGIDRRQRDVAAARLALGEEAEISLADLRTTPIPACHAALLVDVLLYLAPTEQDLLLARAAKALPRNGGVLIVREADAAAGWRFPATVLAERLCAWARGQFRHRYHYRSAAAWRPGWRLWASRWSASP